MSDPSPEQIAAKFSKLAANVTKAHEFQCLRRDREAEDGGEIEYQIFADTEKPKNGLQVAYVQSTKHDAEFIAHTLTHAREIAALLRLPRVESPPEFVEEAKRTRCVDSATDQHGYECVLCGHRLAAVPPRTPGEASPPQLEEK